MATKAAPVAHGHPQPQPPPPQATPAGAAAPAPHHHQHQQNHQPQQLQQLQMLPAPNLAVAGASSAPVLVGPSVPGAPAAQLDPSAPRANLLPQPALSPAPSIPGAIILAANANSNDRKLYVGNLDMGVTETALLELFSSIGDVIAVKIINERSVRGQHVCNYGFIEFRDRVAAEQAFHQLQGHKLFNREFRINWAVQNSHRNDFTNHHHVFVGDLSPGVTDQTLAKAFSSFGSMSEARVMWDTTSGKSRGYGFVAFRQYEDAERAIAQMNGEWLGNRPIRCNWANQRSMPQKVSQPLPFGTVASQSSPFNTTVYVGNLSRGTTQQQITRLFQGFGYISEVRAFPEKGYAFVRLDSHQNASIAIASLHGTTFNGREVKCSWGRDRTQSTPYYPQTTGMPYDYALQYAYYPQTEFVLPRGNGGTGNMDTTRAGGTMHNSNGQQHLMMSSLAQSQPAMQLAWGVQQQQQQQQHQQQHGALMETQQQVSDGVNANAQTYPQSQHMQQAASLHATIQQQ